MESAGGPDRAEPPLGRITCPALVINGRPPTPEFFPQDAQTHLRRRSAAPGR
ncbi:hypothetical protein I545_6913 [Mycobacterium kansasii 662]|uniref:Uncharacterized protein n=1 Tax=Mycobacterium kansasii 662 TaxID=1299326 RepID=X7XQ04_MYCKA|nr:hypothetical protein I545_6913 [Mycobacterium kansasii 662]